MKKIITALYIATTLVFSTASLANEVSPYKVIENVGNNLFERIAQNQQEIKKFPELMRNIVDEELMPHID